METVQSTTETDVEMRSLRRSTRVVTKPQRINYQHADNSKKKTKRSKSKPKDQVITKSKTKTKNKARTSRKNIKSFIDKFADLRKTKISDLFCLVKKHAVNEQDRQEKYVVLQTILKGMKDNDIKNSLVDMYTNKHKLAGYIVTKFLSTQSPMCFTRIIQNIDEMLSYKEVDGIDSINNVSDMMDTTSTLQDGIDALDALQSIFKRLLV